jgi:hypothetical protein
MPDKEFITPEKELLKLIEEKKDTASVKAKTSARKKVSLFSLGGIKGRISYFKTNFKSLLYKGFGLDVKMINLALIILIFIGLLLVTFDFFNSLAKVNDQVEAVFNVERTVSDFKFAEVTPLEAASYYIDKAKKRDIFNMVSQATDASGGQDIAPAVKQIVKKTEGFKLVGIAWSDSPDAMIEDDKSKKTFFLKKGDFINDVEVKEIFKEKVILQYEEEEIELK